MDTNIDLMTETGVIPISLSELIDFDDVDWTDDLDMLDDGGV